ncbi:N-acetyl-D-glucosamine kinase [Pseudobythopirellula maris]|uniref:N-acetyl-D-glucosamine kinase n=1 Tax=Pseudobythopirellula maris TaxID=2527991 RepID=A0A5C5ZQ86_9BACT|nr:ROK family protein [Pseudobythopirellula maris]TWT89664.1 N-acetyl-D-glucosamine kinase [Pseudobythopirellula maris]
MAYYIGVDVGGTTSTLSVGDDSRRVVHVSEQFPTTPDLGPQSSVAAIVAAAAQAMERVGGKMSDVERVGLATPGPATIDGMLLKTPNLKAELWDRFPIRAELEHALQKEHVGVTVRYIGDGQAAALGEYVIRSRQVSWDRVPTSKLEEEKLDSLFMAIVGTGLGGGAVMGGKAQQGSQGRAGHVGHILLPPFAFRHEHDRQLLKGNAYCTAESAISLSGLAHQLEYRLTLDEWKSHPLNSEEGTARDKAKKLRELAAGGDALACELFDDQARALGIAMLSVNYLGDYDRLVVGGGVCDLAPAVRERYQRLAEEEYHKHALDGFRNLDHLEFSVCGDEAPVVGALAWAMEE